MNRFKAIPVQLSALLIVCCCAGKVHAQNVTSPYSILGIGDIDNRDAGRYFITGSSGISRRDANYNFSNPASLTAIPFKVMNMDMGFNGRVSSFKVPGSDSLLPKTKDFVVRRVSVAFKAGNKTGIAFGLKPYSTMSYKFEQDRIILDGNTSYNKLIDGNGGINQAYFSAGHALSKHLSIGITGSWLFGALQRTTSYSSSSIDLAITREDRDFYNAGMVLGGVQYYTQGKNWKHQFGLTGSISSDLKGQLTTEYFENSVSVQKNIDNNRSFRLPVTVGFGYAAVYKNVITITTQAEYQYWRSQAVDYTRSYTDPALRLSGGMEFALKPNKYSSVNDRPFIGWGFNAEQSYLRIKDQPLWDYSVSFGGGMPLFRNVSVYSGISGGIKGNYAKGLIREKYTQFVFALTLRDIWIGTKKFGRYD